MQHTSSYSIHHSKHHPSAPTTTSVAPNALQYTAHHTQHIFTPHTTTSHSTHHRTPSTAHSTHHSTSQHTRHTTTQRNKARRRQWLPRSFPLTLDPTPENIREPRILPFKLNRGHIELLWLSSYQEVAIHPHSKGR